MNLTISQILISSLLALLFLFGNRVLGKSVSAITRFAIGMILAVVFLIPIRLPILKVPLLTPPKTEDAIPFLGEDEMQDLFFGEIAIPEKTPAQAPQTGKQGIPTVSPRALFAAAYLLGVLFTLFRMIFRYCRTAKAMLRCGRAPSEKERARFEAYYKEMGVRRAPRLLVCPASALPSPLMFGFFRQTVLLSDEMSAENASVLIGHELMHCKRNDPLWKLIFALLRALYWFHPAVRLFIRTMNFLCEEACDEAFLREKSKEEKLFYCKLLVMTASSLNMEHSTAFTAFKGGKTQMKQRLQNILTKKNHKIALIFVSVIMIVALLSVSVYAAITPEKETEKNETTADVYYYSEEEIEEKNEQIVKNHLEWFGIDLSEEVANPQNSVTFRTDGFIRAGRYNGANAMLTPEGEPVIYLAVDGQLWKLDYTPGLVENGVGIHYISNGDGTGTVEYVDMKTVLDEFIYNFSWASLRKEEGYPAENGSDYDAFYRDLKAFCEEHAHEDVGSPFPFYGPSFKFFTTLYHRADVEIPQ